MQMKYTRFKHFSSGGAISKLLVGKCGFVGGFVLGFCIFAYFAFTHLDTRWSFQTVTHDNPVGLESNDAQNLLLNIQELLVRGSQQPEQSHTTIAEFLHKQVKVLCWVMTSPKTLRERAFHVNKTWGKRCNKILFMSTKLDDELLDVVALPVTEGRDFLWSKTKEALRYIYRYHMDDYDWFLKTDDDTYVVLENLRYMLYAYPTDMPIYFGCRFKKYVRQGYMSGGAGYVLSKEALRRFAEKGIHDDHKCKIDEDGAEDVELGICMERLDIVAGDSRDNLQRGKFFPANVEYQIFPPDDKNDWIYEFDFYGVRGGFDCCSNNAISFHYIQPREMYVYDYLIYYLQPYGHIDIPQGLPAKLTAAQVLHTTQTNNIPTEATSHINSESTVESTGNSTPTAVTEKS